MQELLNLKLPKQMGAFVPLASSLKLALQARYSFLPMMSGYPAPSAAVGMIQSRLNLDSLSGLLSSCQRIRDLGRFAHDVIQSNTLLRVDKSPLNRSELMAYIELQTESSGMQLTQDDVAFVAHIIMSADAVESTWELQFAETDEGNRWLKFHRLYQSIGELNTPELGGDPNQMGANALVVYDPLTDSIVPFMSLPRVASWITTVTAAAARIDDNDAKASYLIAQQSNLNDWATIYKVATLRLIDHIVGLLSDIDLWRGFVPPRTKVDPSANIERGKGLRLMSTYFHSLLMYPQIFNLELFLATYHKTQQWVTTFPPIAEHVHKQYEMSVRKYDVLGAQADVASIMSNLDDNDNSMGVNVIGLPAETQFMFDLDSIIRNVIAMTSVTPTPIYVDRFSDLKKPEYKYFLFSHPVAEYNVIPNLVSIVTLKNQVAEEIVLSSASVQLGIERYYPEEMLSRFVALGIKLAYGFGPRVPSVQPFNKTTSATLSGGTLNYGPLTPIHSFDYQWNVRNDRYLTIFKASELWGEDGQFRPKIGFNFDTALRLRNQTRRNFSSLYPSSVMNGDKVFNAGMFTTGNPIADEQMLKSLFESITGQHWNLVKIEIGSEFVKRMYATYLSSFALLYVTPKPLADFAKPDKKGNSALPSLSPYLVSGHGKPYGLSYDALESRQGVTDSVADYIQVTDNVYIRFLNTIPIPTTSMTVDADFYARLPYFYYAANSAKISGIKNWVMSEGLLNFATFPLSSNLDKAPALLTPKQAYINDRLLIQPDMVYSIGSSASGDEKFSIPLVETSWSYDIWNTLIRYVKPGSYSAISSAASVDVSDINKINKEIEAALQAVESQDPVNTMQDAKTNPLTTVNKAPEDLTKQVPAKSKSKKKEEAAPEEEEKLDTDLPE